MTVFGVNLEASEIWSRSLFLSGKRWAMETSGGATLPEDTPATRWHAMQLPFRRSITIQPPWVTASFGGFALSSQTFGSGACPAALAAGIVISVPRNRLVPSPRARVTDLYISPPVLLTYKYAGYAKAAILLFFLRMPDACTELIGAISCASRRSYFLKTQRITPLCRE